MRTLFSAVLFCSVLFSGMVSAAELPHDKAVATTAPNIEAGKKTYELCATCHGVNGWGEKDGSFPVLAGQHASVIIKQLTDIRARNRENPTMFPFAGDDVLGGEQGMKDVAAYLSRLPSAPSHGVGSGDLVEEGKKLFSENCVACHGSVGQGDAQFFFPKIQGQHYAYLLRQLTWIRDGRRKNANPAMLALVKTLDDKQLSAIADYVSRLPLTP